MESIYLVTSNLVLKIIKKNSESMQKLVNDNIDKSMNKSIDISIDDSKDGFINKNPQKL